jgi:hypothetical protein
MEEKFEPMGTKISPSAAVVWNAVCEALETDTYHLLQQFIYAMIRGASEQHEKSPEIERLMQALDLDAGWQNAINLCAPNGKLSIAQMILIVEQEGKKGFGAVMLDKPFMGECQQTENVDRIFERLTEVIFKRTYMKLREAGQMMKVKSQRELLETMADATILQELNEGFAREMPGMGEHAYNGRTYGYGKKTKAKQKRTPDSVADDKRYHQPHIVFDDYDRTTTDVSDEERDLDKELSTRFIDDD